MENTARLFSDIDTWVFDLDNTLYPHHVDLWHQVDARIGEFVGAFLGVSAEEARRIQKDYYRRYGTTMRGMMSEHGVHADDFLAYVHQIDHSPLQPNPAMGAAIEQLERPIDRVADFARGRGRDAVACIERGVNGGLQGGQRHRISLASGIKGF